MRYERPPRVQSIFQEDDGWFRLSAGAVSEPEIEAALPRLAAALRSLT
ncbi:MAG TPA: hypothetical protein VHQ90_25065 [Thermoanaerobaculia bacterium]|nr:hypothetical protein [Thermoanaerobaculia bacterium]